MGLQERICPTCGGPSQEGGVCDRCRAGSLEWFRCDHRVESIRCPACDARKRAGSWSDIVPERDAVVRELAGSAVHLHPDVKKPEISITYREKGPTRTIATVRVSGDLYGIVVTASCEVTIAWRNEQCDRCSRISGSYYEGVVQVRAEGRRPYPYEVRRAAGIAAELEDSLQGTGDRLSFISHLDETKDGLDITVGSQSIGQAIVDGIIGALGGRCTTHPKLVGEKAGRPLYRITYAVRLPRLTRGDVFESAGHYGLVTQVGPRVVRYLDIGSGQARTARPDHIGRVVGNSRDAVHAVVAWVEGATVGLLDPDSGETRECVSSLCARIPPGSEIRVVRDGDLLVPVGGA